MVNELSYRPGGSSASVARIRRSVSSRSRSTTAATSAAPKRSCSSSMRRAITFTPATSACTSPTTLSGVRLLRSMMRSTSSTGSPSRQQAHRRQQQAFDEGVGGQRGQSGGRDPADVGDVDERAGEEHDAAVGEHRPEHEDVVGVDPAAVRVVEREHVAGPHRGEREVLEQRRQRASEAGGVHQAGGGRQRDQLAAGVDQRGTGVGALLDVRAVAGAHHDDARLLGRDGEPVADDLAGDGVVDGGHGGTLPSAP